MQGPFQGLGVSLGHKSHWIWTLLHRYILLIHKNGCIHLWEEKDFISSASIRPFSLYSPPSFLVWRVLSSWATLGGWPSTWCIYRRHRTLGPSTNSTQTGTWHTLAIVALGGRSRRVRSSSLPQQLSKFKANQGHRTPYLKQRLIFKRVNNFLKEYTTVIPALGKLRQEHHMKSGVQG